MDKINGPKGVPDKKQRRIESERRAVPAPSDPLETAGVDPGLLYKGGTVESQAQAIQRLPTRQQQAAVEQIGRTQGNRHVQSLIKNMGASQPVQPATAVPPASRPTAVPASRGAIVQGKLSVSQPGDPYEVEAERMADEVMRMPDRATPPPDDPKNKKGIVISRSGHGEGIQVTAGMEGQIGRLKGRGEPLPAAEREFFESRMGTDLGQVRIHHDGEAAALSDQLEARAFTVGRDVVFGQGEYRPGTNGGRHLMAHELTHVMQQAGSTPRKTVNRCADGHCRAAESRMKRVELPDEEEMQAQPLVYRAVKANRCRTSACHQESRRLKPDVQRAAAGKTDSAREKDTALEWARGILDRFTNSARKKKDDLRSDGDEKSGALLNEVPVLGSGLEIERGQKGAQLESESQLQGGQLENRSTTLGNDLRMESTVKGNQLETEAGTRGSALEAEADGKNQQMEQDWGHLENEGQEKATGIETQAEGKVNQLQEEAGASAQEVEGKYSDFQDRTVMQVQAAQEEADSLNEMCQQVTSAGLKVGGAFMLGGGLGTILFLLWPKIQELWDRLSKKIPLLNQINQEWERLQRWGQSLWDGVAKKAGELGDWIREQAAAGWGWIQARWGDLNKKCGQIVAGIKDRAVQTWTTLKVKATDLWKGLKNRVTQTWTGLKGQVTAAWSSLKGNVLAAWSGLKAKGTQAWNGLKSKGNQFVSAIAGKGKNAVHALQSLGGQITKWFGGLVSNTLNGVKDFGDSVAQKLGGNALKAWNGLKQISTRAWEGLKQTGTLAWQGLRRVGTWAWTNLKQVGTWAWNGLKNAGTQAWRGLQGLGNRALGVVKGGWNGIKQGWQGLSRWGQNIFRKVVGFTQKAGQALYARIIRPVQTGIEKRWRALQARIAPAVARIKKNWENLQLNPLGTAFDKLKQIFPQLKMLEELYNQRESLKAQMIKALQEKMVQVGPKARELLAQAFAAVTDKRWAERHSEGVARHLEPKLLYLMDTSNWGEIASKALKDLLWPWPGVAEDFQKMNQTVDLLAGSLCRMDLSGAIDHAIEIGRILNSIVGRLYGWFTLACVLLGAAVGGGAGALAGLSVAGGVGGVLTGSTLVVEGANIAKAVVDLCATCQTVDQAEEDYERISESAITMAMMAIMYVLGKLIEKLVKAAIQAFKRAKARYVQVKNGTKQYMGAETAPGKKSINVGKAAKDVARERPLLDQLHKEGIIPKNVNTAEELAPYIDDGFSYAVNKDAKFRPDTQYMKTTLQESNEVVEAVLQDKVINLDNSKTPILEKLKLEVLEKTTIKTPNAVKGRYLELMAQEFYQSQGYKVMDLNRIKTNFGGIDLIVYPAVQAPENIAYIISANGTNLKSMALKNTPWEGGEKDSDKNSKEAMVGPCAVSLGGGESGGGGASSDW